jgi:hypothetical protein
MRTKERPDMRRASEIVRVPLSAPSSSPAAVPTGGVSLVRCTIKANVAADHLHCNPFGSPPSKRIRVVKPYEFQKTAWHGLKVNGIHYNFLGQDRAELTLLDAAGNLTDTKLIRVVTPPYGVSSPNPRDRQIIVARGVEGGTGVKTEAVNDSVVHVFSGGLWTIDPNSGWSFAGDVGIHGPGQAGRIRETDALVTGTVYDATFTVSSYVAGSVQVFLGSSVGTTRAANGTYLERLTCSGAGAGGLDFGFLASADFNGRVQTITCIVRTPAESPWQDLNVAGRQWLDETS